MARTAAGDDPGDQARPARVRRGGDTGDRVGEQDRHAVGGEDGEGETALGGDDGVDPRDRAVPPGRVDHGDVGPVHLVHPDHPGRVDAQRLGRQLPVGGDGSGVVADRAAEVELLVRNGVHSAPPVGEAEVRAVHGVALSYHFRKSGTSSSSAALSE